MKPVIKWSGSKRSQANEILKYIPKFETYYEPFCGGASIAYSLSPSNGVCGDICEPLINLWNLIKSNPESVCKIYQDQWTDLQSNGVDTYYKIRDHFNITHSPYDLLFLSRTCVNGLIRFNKNGDFNNSFHLSRKGINPDTLQKIIFDWSNKIQNIKFVNSDYRETTKNATSNDFIYLDPPYFNTKGRYYGTIDFEQFINYLEDLNNRSIKYMLSFDGKRGEENFFVEIPSHLYKRHILISSGNSPFKKVMDKQNKEVFESLYMNF